MFESIELTAMKSTPPSLLSHALTAWFSPLGNGGSVDDFEQMQSALNTSRPLNADYFPHVSLASTTPVARIGNSIQAAVIGTPYWVSETLQLAAQNCGHSHTLALAYQQQGIDCLSSIKGAFSFVIFDKESELLYAGIDRLGQFPLYYSMLSSGLILASNAASVLAHSQVPNPMSPQGVYDYMYFHMIPSPTSIYENLKKLPAAHYVKCERGCISAQPYWLPEYIRPPSKDFDDLRQEFQLALKNSVLRATSKTQSTGSFLSGGLDSSTVTGMLAEVSDGEVQAYSIGFDAEGYDEMAYARITAEHFGVKLNEYYVTPDDVVNALPLIATSYDEPFGNSSALPAWFCAKFAAEQGITRLLAGDGGDELFAGNERYGIQRVFELYSKAPRRLRTGLIEPIVGALPDKIALASKAKSYIYQANTALPERLQYYNFLHQHDAREIFCDDLLANIDTSLPLQLQKNIYDRPKHASTLDRMLYLDWQYTLADNDLRKVSHTAALAGTEVLYPLLDDELLEMSCRIPDSLKLKGNNLRFFFKEALKDWLPPATITKKKHGFGLPFGVWMRTHNPLQEIAYDTLLQLKQRKYFRPEFIDSTIKLHRDGHASYYGELIWIMMTLELWLQRITSE